MAFIDTTLVTSKDVAKGSTSYVSAQSLSTYNAGNTPNQVLGSLSTTLTGVSNDISKTASIARGVQTTAVQLEKTAVQTASSVESFIATAKKSVNAIFGSSSSDLASGVSGSFSDIFKNTNNPQGSGVTRVIPDATYTNLLQAKAPISTAFKVDSAFPGSQGITGSGATSTTGSGDTTMTGTALSTVLDRYNLDSSANLTHSLASFSTDSKLKGLFSSISSVVGTVQKVSQIATTEIKSVNNVVGAVRNEFSAVSRVVASAKNTASKLTSISSLNDLNSFVGSVSSLSGSLNNLNLSTYYVASSTNHLVDQTGAIVNVLGAGVDASTANNILDAMRSSGCYSGNTYYTSGNVNASLFNTSLNLAAQYGMMNEVSTLLGCSHASTVMGQQALSSAFVSSANSQISIAGSILGGITNPYSLNTPYVAQTIVTNPNLTAANLGQVESMFNLMGTNTKSAFAIGDTGSSAYPTYNAALLYNAQPSFTNAVFDDTTLSDYFNASELSVSPTGFFSLPS